MRRFRVMFLLTLASMLHTQDALAADESLINAARRREELFRSVIIRFSIKEFVAKGQVSANSPPDRKKMAMSIPPNDTELVSENQLVIDRQMGRYENNHPLWQIDTGALLRTSSIVVTDNKYGKLFFANGISGNGKPRGVIWADASPSGLREPVLTALTTHFRGLQPHLCPYSLAELKRTDNASLIDGHKCQEYALPSKSTRTITFYIDEQEQYVIRRLRKLNSGKITYQLDIEYRQHEHGPIPQRWTLSDYDSRGKVISKKEMTVLEATINGEVDREQFDITYPEGCKVHDQRNSKDYIVQANGKMRELSATGELLTEELRQPSISWFAQYGWTLWLIGAGAAVCGLGYYAIRKRCHH